MKVEVAIIYDRYGTEIGCLKCKMVNEGEYHNLVDKTIKHLQEEHEKELALAKCIEELNAEVVKLKEEIKLLKGEE